MSLLVFGASGFLGREIFACLHGRGEKVVGTYCSRPHPRLMPFDLRGTIDLRCLGLPLSDVTHAIICSSAADMDRCRTEWDATYRINVAGTIALIRELQRARIVPVFLSTDYVYDGLKGNYSESDERKPVLAYGRQKLEVENFLINAAKPFLIVRPSRVYSYNPRDQTLLTSIARALQNGLILRMATDQIFTPSYVVDVSQAIAFLVGGQRCGCFNLGPAQPISRFALATALQERLRIRSGRIDPCLLRDLTFGDHRPADTSLSSRRFIDAGGFEFTTIEQSLAVLEARPWIFSAPDSAR